MCVSGRWLTFALSSPRLLGVDKHRETGALLIAACIIAAIRLRGEPIRPSPKLTSTVAEAVALAKTVLRELQRA